MDYILKLSLSFADIFFAMTFLEKNLYSTKSLQVSALDSVLFICNCSKHLVNHRVFYKMEVYVALGLPRTFLILLYNGFMYCIDMQYTLILCLWKSGPFAVIDEHFSTILPNCYDAIGLMLMIRITHQHQVMFSKLSVYLCLNSVLQVLV